VTDDVAWVVPEGTDPPASVPAEVFDAAVSAYRAGERLDMQQLARSLGVSRATLYRRTGNRESLMAEVIWWDGRRSIIDAIRRSGAFTGVERVVEVTRLVLMNSIRSVPLQRFLEADPEGALRVLTGARGGVQHRYIDCFERLFELETARGHLSLGIDITSLTFALIRIAEGFLYADVIANQRKDVGDAVAIIDGLLHGLDTSAAPAPSGPAPVAG
jgi:AcrR family transcriptional regulator